MSFMKVDLPSRMSLKSRQIVQLDDHQNGDTIRKKADRCDGNKTESLHSQAVFLISYRVSNFRIFLVTASAGENNRDTAKRYAK